MSIRDIYGHPIHCIAPHVWYQAERSILLVREDDLGEVASALCELYYSLRHFRERDAFFLQEWTEAYGPVLLETPEDALLRNEHDVEQLRAARRTLFALMQRMGYPFRLGYRWPIESNNDFLWKPDAELLREAAA